MLRSSNATPNVDSQRTANPIVTGGSVVGVKYNGGEYSDYQYMLKLIEGMAVEELSLIHISEPTRPY